MSSSIHARTALDEQAPRAEAPRSESLAVRPARAPVVAFDPLWAAALRAEGRAGAGSDLGGAWHDLVSGRLVLLCESVGLARVQLLARVAPAPRPARPPLSAKEAELALRLVSGEAPREISADLGVAPGAVRRGCLRALRALGLPPQGIPLPLVLAARAFAGAPSPRGARCVAFEHRGCDCVLLGAPRPRPASGEGLSYPEREVAQLVVEGCGAGEIARRRGTSVGVVSRQIRGVFAKWQVSGRYELVRGAVRGGWFR